MRSDRAFALLVRENPVDEDDLPEVGDPEARFLRERILLEDLPRRGPRSRNARSRSQRQLVRASAAVASLGLAAGAAALLLVGTPRGSPTVENAHGAVTRAAAVTAASAKRSGTAVVRITHGRELWAQTSIRWNGADLAVSHEAPRRPRRAGSELRLIDGIVYGLDPEDGGWVAMGGPENIDPDSGTTPAEYLAAVREDVGGATLRRLTDAMTRLTTGQLDDGSTVYSGSVAAGLVARESGFKEGQSIRVLPFGYVAHDEAADPTAAVHAAVTVGPDGIVRDVTATWGTGASAWVYRVTYNGLGTTPRPEAPANARSLLKERLRAGG